MRYLSIGAIAFWSMQGVFLVRGSIPVDRWEAQPDARASQILLAHKWFFLDQAKTFSPIEIHRLDPWAQASWWGESSAQSTGEPILGIVWNATGGVAQVLPCSQAEQSGVTEGNLVGIRTAKGEMRPIEQVTANQLQTDTEAFFLLKNGKVCNVKKRGWTPPGVWREGARFRIYSLDRNAGVTWEGLCPKVGERCLDLRGSPGGFTDAALQILGTFLGPDRVVGDYWFRDKWRRLRHTYLMTPAQVTKTLSPSEWTIIVDRHTASAAELIASALTYYGARIEGGSTFGKRWTQDEVVLDHGGSMKFSVGKWKELHAP